MRKVPAGINSELRTGWLFIHLKDLSKPSLYGFSKYVHKWKEGFFPFWGRVTFCHANYVPGHDFSIIRTLQEQGTIDP